MLRHSKPGHATALFRACFILCEKVCEWGLVCPTTDAVLSIPTRMRFPVIMSPFSPKPSGLQRKHPEIKLKRSGRARNKTRLRVTLLLKHVAHLCVIYVPTRTFCIWKLKIVLVFKKAVGGKRGPDGKEQKDTIFFLHWWPDRLAGRHNLCTSIQMSLYPGVHHFSCPMHCFTGQSSLTPDLFP